MEISRNLFVLFFCLLLLFLFLFDLYFARAILPRQVDDVHPSIFCENEIFNKSEILMVIPLFNNVSIADNKAWCRYVLGLNKTIGMHGVYHTYKEFNVYRDKEYIQLGMEEFKKCFGFYPTIFQAPQLAFNSVNNDNLKVLNMSLRSNLFQTLHKVYHCSDTGKYSNKIIDAL